MEPRLQACRTDTFPVDCADLSFGASPGTVSEIESFDGGFVTLGATNGSNPVERPFNATAVLTCVDDRALDELP